MTEEKKQAIMNCETFDYSIRNMALRAPLNVHRLRRKQKLSA